MRGADDRRCRNRGILLTARHDRTRPHSPSRDPDHRFRQPGDPAHRAARARGRRLLGDRAVRQGVRRLFSAKAKGRHPFRRAGIGAGRRQPARPAGGVRGGRSGARHLLRPDDHGRTAWRRGRRRTPPRVRARARRHQGDVRPFRRRLAARREAHGVDEPRRPDHGAAAGLQGQGHVRQRALRHHRGREAPLLWPDVPSGGRAYAGRRAAHPEFRAQGRGASRRLDDGGVQGGGDFAHPRGGEAGPRDLRAFRRRRFRRWRRC